MQLISSTQNQKLANNKWITSKTKLRIKKLIAKKQLSFAWNTSKSQNTLDKIIANQQNTRGDSQQKTSPRP